MENRAIVMTEIGHFEEKDVPMPKVKSGDVLVKIEYVGICGSDVHFFESGHCGASTCTVPFILGHEVAGTVIEVGENVTTHKVGDRVALEPGQTCGKCEFCKTGHYNLCEDVVFFATPPYDGALMKYVAYPAHMAFILPENVSTMEGALVEPLSVGIHAAMQGGVKLGSTVMVNGTGCIGLVTLLAAKAAGASQIIVSDVFNKRLEKAVSLGATHIINAAEEDVPGKVAEYTGGRGVDIVFETSGNIKSIGQTIDNVRRGGTVVMIGYSPADEVGYNFGKLIDKEVTIKSVFRYRNIYPTAIQAISSGSICIKNIVTHEFDFENSYEAFVSVSNNKQDVIKGVIKL
ncbi:L-iditol 2-dehydrogenase [Ruminiclostridium sufflavum DSM 19573]|uniref:L-iditol 2-dehydrogenase n=1 Tax=Ruminiclostridium sufflavum DSM 19573 TaxID=1121337 RepID=A0A318XLG2_9FIRM|nr:NAD(P)-dependent alcohol dehydrogenase [Ruminiclostridium sufflavum]PYG88167.1 L-iditol 2-dehydrogenase [Ruminiclostridium sufflavum DSM 19573]